MIPLSTNVTARDSVRYKFCFFIVILLIPAFSAWGKRSAENFRNIHGKRRAKGGRILVNPGNRRFVKSSDGSYTCRHARKFRTCSIRVLTVDNANGQASQVENYATPI